MSDGWQSGWMRRVLAALPALALLAVPGTPMRHPATAASASYESVGRGAGRGE